VTDVVDELVAHARAAKRARLTYEREMEQVRALLPVVRVSDPKKYGPRKLENLIEGELERGTISRLTAEAAGTSRKHRES
jgi:hypothetical protein